MNNIAVLPFSEVVKAKLTFLVESVLREIPECEKIVLFGSYARMEQKIGSDLDILILTKKEIERDRRGELYAVFEENNADIVFYTKEIFDKSEKLLVQQIKKEGILLWKN